MAGVARVSARVLRVPLSAGFRIAYQEQAAAETLLVEVELESGVVGVGEASPAPRVTGETLEASLGYVEALSQRLRGLRVPGELGGALRLVHGGAPFFPAARAALEAALLAAAAEELGVEAWELLGGRRWPGHLVTDYTIGLPPRRVLEELGRGGGPGVDALVEAVEYLVGLRSAPPEEAPVPLPGDVNGFNVLKVKLGTGDPGLDLRLAELVAEASSGRARIRVDANQAWSPHVAARMLRLLEERLGDLLELVEQPVPVGYEARLAEARRSSTVPVALDESVKTPADVARVSSLGAGDIVNIKLAKAGGPLEAQRIVAAAEAHGLGVMWGCMVETGYGIAWAAIAAAASGHASILDLDSPLFLEEDPGAEALAYRGLGAGGVAVEPRTPARRLG